MRSKLPERAAHIRSGFLVDNNSARMIHFWRKLNMKMIYNTNFRFSFNFMFTGR
jgi:hypothetical protein